MKLRLRWTTQNWETKLKNDPFEPTRMNTTLMQHTTTCGGVGWRRVVYLNMTDSKTNCHSGWQLTGYSKITCGRVSTGWRTCDSVFFPISGGPYSQLCGKIWPTSMDIQFYAHLHIPLHWCTLFYIYVTADAFLGNDEGQKQQLTVPTSVVWLYCTTTHLDIC